jgi:hypothetical protein
MAWNEGVAIDKPTALASTNPAVAAPTGYVAKDQKNVRRLEAFEGCANPSNATARVQVLVKGKWLPIKSIKSGWKETSSACPVAQLGKKNSLAWADVYIDEGVTIRWYFTGEVNIFHRDNLGNGYSESTAVSLPAPLVTPHEVDNKYGITWQNITTRVKDISAAAFTDAQATIARNQGLASAADVFKTYISPGSVQIYPGVEHGPNLMKRTFSLFAKYPHTKQVFYVATTMDEIKQTFAKIDSLYPSGPFMKNTYDALYGINTNLPAGSVYTHAKCDGGDSGRNTSDWKNGMVASAIVWSFCPITNNPRSHIESDHGVPHEHTHNVQAQIYNGKQFDVQPCWMKEGEAEWTQTAASETFTEYLDLQHFHPYYLSSDGLNYRQLTQTTWTPSELDEYFKEAVVMPCNTTPRQAMSYSAGAAAIEALVAIRGSESFFAVDQRIASGMKFADAFKEIYGVTWDYAETILADVVAQKLTLAQSKDALTYQTRP